MTTRRVHSLMVPHPQTLEDSDTVMDAITLMVGGGFRHLPVVRKGVVVGFVSDRDLVGPAAKRRDPEGLQLQGQFAETRLRSVMTSRPLSVRPEDTVADALALMIEHRLSAVPVVDSGLHPVGVLSLVDVARELFQLLKAA